MNIYPSTDRLDERIFVAPHRQRLFSRATGKVLDVACGDGVNFAHVPPACELTAGDINAPQISSARSRAASLGRPVDLRIMDAHALPFPDDIFDTVISSLSVCSFDDPVRALREMARVTRPDGRILLFEHGRSSVGLVAAWQDWTERRRGVHTGCHVNREPLELAHTAGLEIVTASRTWLGALHLIEARPGAARP